MIMQRIVLVLLGIFFVTKIRGIYMTKRIAGKGGIGPGKQEWGYANVKPNGMMFWWLYYTTANVTSYTEKPLVIWLQGGPGSSSSGYGNFELIGPFDTNFKRRNNSWVNYFNVLFIDSPVGTGFSYAGPGAFATTNTEAAKDLVSCMKSIFQKVPYLRSIPTYIVGESYGGKIAIEFARIWYEEQKSGKINSTLKGVGLGDSWISPIDSVMSWAPYLLFTGVIDTFGYIKIRQFAVATKSAVENGQWRLATDRMKSTQAIIFDETKHVDVYNILGKVPYVNVKGERRLNNYNIETLRRLMNNYVKPRLNLVTNFGSQIKDVSLNLNDEILKPVVNQVEHVLNNTDLKVYVYNGQLDLIVDTAGTLVWVNHLRWKKSQQWRHVKREPFVVNDVVEGYVKKLGQFAMYWINRSGHMVPKDNPTALLKMMERFTYND